MGKIRLLNILAGLLCMLACASCAPSNSLMQISGYDADGVRTGSLIPSPGTLTPY